MGRPVWGAYSFPTFHFVLLLIVILIFYRQDKIRRD
jgi:hypothetical protein